jgi:hypothetical protein
MERGTRVRLTADFIDEYRRRFVAGQVGTAGATLDGHVLVDFDGYAAERASAKEFEANNGESPNVVPWLAIVPVDLLKAVQGEQITDSRTPWK